MKNIKRYIVILSVIIIILIGILAIYNYFKNKEEPDPSQEDMSSGPQDIITEEVPDLQQWEEEENPSHYYAIKNIVDNYYTDMAKFASDYVAFIRDLPEGETVQNATQEEQELAMQKLKAILSNYINENKLNDNQLKEMFKSHSSEEVTIDKLYYKKQSDFIDLYYIESTINEANKGNNIIIIVDNSTDAYTLLPMEYVEEKFGDKPDMSKIVLDDSILKIENKSFNKITYRSISDQEMCMYYLGDYLNNIRTDTKKVYNQLDDEYKKLRFKNYETFEKYIKDNYETLKNRNLSKYIVYDNYDDNTRTYICQDQKNCYYVFKATAIMNYSLILDNHTTFIKDLEDKYVKADPKEKASMNIEKIIDAVNTKDYEYIYSKLNSSLKNNNFKSQADLEKFISENMFEYNKFDYIDTKVQDEEYSFSIKLTNVLNDNESKTIKLVLTLNGDTDFIITKIG